MDEKEILELRQKRSALVEKAGQILAKAKAEGRDVTDEEDTEVTRCHDEARKLAKDVKTRERQLELERGIAQSTGTLAGGRAQPGEGTEKATAADGDPVVQRRSTPEFRERFRRFLAFAGGPAEMPEQREGRAMQADSPTGGGYSVAPIQFAQEFLQGVTARVFVRRLARTFQLTTAASLGVIKKTSGMADAEWTSELAIGGESEIAIGMRQLVPHPLSKEALLSRRLQRVSVINWEQLIRDDLSEVHARAQEKGFLTGSGAGQPLGLYTASADGIDTSRDSSAENTTTAVTLKGMKKAKYKLLQEYWGEAQWLMHIDLMEQLDNQVDGVGRPLLQPDIASPTGFRYIGFPINTSQYNPNTLTTGLYVAILGAFRFYWIADALDMTVERIDQVHYKKNQLGFVGRVETDGAPQLAEAFVRVKLA